MGRKPIHKMPVRDRAKQFMPFSPLKGLEEAIAKKEMEILKRPRAILSADAEELLNRKMQDIYIGDEITLIYYEKGLYLTTCGEIEEINVNNRYFKIKDKIILFSDVFDVVRN